MANVPRRRALRLAAALAAAVGLAAPSAGASEEPAVDLIGTWYVLVHYTDDHSHDPEQLRWDDRVWVFERSGSRLRWIEYPIVVFADETGRFETVAGIGKTRVMHAWEPNAGQRAAIAAGLEVNSRGQKSKTLRRSGGDGWRSATRATAASASIVTYVEHWSIDRAATLPVFRREDVLGAGRAEDLEGTTEYTTQEVRRGGDLLRGSFERDGSRHGTFRMQRSGGTRALEGRTASEGQRFYGAYLHGLQAALERRAAAIAPAAAAFDGGGEAPSELRRRSRAEVRAAVEESVREAGADPADFEREIDGLRDEIERRMVEEGQSAAAIAELLRQGRINP